MSAVDEEIIVDPAREAVAAPAEEEGDEGAPPPPASTDTTVEGDVAPSGEPHGVAAAPPPPPPPEAGSAAAPPSDSTAAAPEDPKASITTKKTSSAPSGKSDSQKKKKPPHNSNTTTTTSAVAGAGSTRGGASTRAAATQKAELTTGPHVNARYQTVADEHARFRRQQGARPTYKGPVYVAEDVHVLCAECHTPVDPVSRVPVGPHLFYHEHCLRCAICGRRGVAEPFVERAGQPVCGACAEKGYAATQVRRMHPTAVPSPPPQGTTLSRTLNQTAVRGAVPPSLQVTPHLHDRCNTTDRSFALMQRQQYFTQNDANLLTQMPPEEPERGGRGHKKNSVKEVEGGDDGVPALE